MYRPAFGKESLFQRGILTMGSVHTHDELIGIVNGRSIVAVAEYPSLHIIPLEDRIEQFEEGECIFTIFRWNQTKADLHFYKAIEVGIEFASMLHIPYDLRAIRTHIRNYIRRNWFPFLPLLSSHREASVFCTEFCSLLYKLGLVDLNNYWGEQPLVAPIHSERLYMRGFFDVVEDFGLLKYLDMKKI
jgi:hypothetical protein